MVRARERSDRVVAASVAVLNASFRAQWSNPLWEALAFAVDTESERVLALLGRAAARMPVAHEAGRDITDDELRRIFNLHAVAWHVRFLWLVPYAMASLTAAAAWMSTEAVLRHILRARCAMTAYCSSLRNKWLLRSWQVVEEDEGEDVAAGGN